MSDTIGRITVPSIVSSGQTFPLTSDIGYGFAQERPVVVHRFGELDAKAEQRFAVGLGPRKFAFRRQHLSKRDRNSLITFWEAIQGAWQSFTYNVPNADQTTTPTTVTWEYAPLSLQYLANACQTGFNLIEVPTAGPTYQVNSTCLRFPSSALQTALLSQVQQIIPLIHIRVRESAVPDIWLSDRRCTLSDNASGLVKTAMSWSGMSQTYLPRVLGLGEPGSDTIISQDIKGTADSVQFTFGNADRVMTALANDTDLKFACIDLCLLHVNSNIVIQLWKGFIVSYTTDGTPQFTVRCSDGLFQITQMYPVRAISRQCWKTFNDGVNCPYSLHGSGGDPSSCDYYFDSANGCQAHNMTKYFGGHPAEPQGVVIKDNSTGLWGIGRSTVTATSIISDTIWGNALQEIWCNDDGDPGKAFWVNCMIAAGRDESDYYDGLGIVGAGPIGSYTGMLVYTNADGYRYIIAPMLDGQTPQGFQVDGNLNVTKDQPTMGLREVTGNDPCDLSHDSFSLGQGTPQVWGPQMAAGTAFVEIRRTDQKGIQPTTTDQHQMQVPISQGLAGYTWDQNGTRTLVNGLTNPFWIAVNCFLRCIGLFGASSATQLQNFVLASLYKGDGSGAAEIADDWITPVIGTGLERQWRFQGVLAQQKPFRDWLVEILACGLGYFTFEFGQLKLGSRINASAVESFTLGNIQKLGLVGEIDHYCGVFWWNQRKASGGLYPSATITFGDGWLANDTIWVHIGDGAVGKSVFPADTSETIAAHFAHFINATLVGVWAEANGAVLTITCRSTAANWLFSLSIDISTAHGTATVVGDLQTAAAAPTWVIDPTAGQPLNRAIRDWHADYFAALKVAGIGVVVSFSQELVNPPDDPAAGAVWTQRYPDNSPASTDTGFGGLYSSMSAFSTPVVNYLAAVYAEMGALMAAAGLTPRLQFGEVLWWYIIGASGMGFYDADTKTAAQATLGRALHTFVTSNDDPSVNGYEDANFLAARLAGYVAAVQAAVLAQVPSALFEILWPLDVNDPTNCRLLHYVNLPPAWTTRAGSGFDTFLCEGFQYGGIDFNLDEAQTCAGYPFTVLSWDRAHCKYLEGWYNPAWPWAREFQAAQRTAVPLIKFWAYDHICLFGWPLPLPKQPPAPVIL